MNKHTRILKSLKEQLGAELRRVRQEKGLKIEETVWGGDDTVTPRYKTKLTK